MKIILPLSIVLPRKTKKDKVVYLNLNNYRNWSFFLSNDIKQKYCAALRPQLEGLKIKTPIKLFFTLHRKDSRISDRSNVLSIIEKFTCDALVQYGCIPDDNDKYIISSYYESGEKSKNNPCCILEIKSV